MPKQQEGMVDEPVDVPAPRLTRDQIRAKILATRTPTRKVITFFGEQIEIRQPLLGDIVKLQGDGEENRSAIVNTLVKYAFIPGTDEHIFEEGDADTLNQMPFGNDFVAVIEALQELTAVNFRAQKPA